VSFLQKRRDFLLIPLVSVFLWFRFENSYHQSLFLFFIWILAAIAGAFLLEKSLPRQRFPVAIGLWIAISILISADFIQQSIYSGYSERRFVGLIDSSTSEIQHRLKNFIDQSRKSSRDIEQRLQTIK